MFVFVKIVAAIYHWFDERGVDIPHFRTLIILIGLLNMHLFQFSLLFHEPMIFPLSWLRDHRNLNWLFGFFIRWRVDRIVLPAFSKEKTGSDSRVNGLGRQGWLAFATLLWSYGSGDDDTGFAKC